MLKNPFSFIQISKILNSYKNFSNQNPLYSSNLKDELAIELGEVFLRKYKKVFYYGYLEFLFFYYFKIKNKYRKKVLFFKDFKQSLRAFADPKGFYMLDFMLESACVPRHYYDIFYKIPYLTQSTGKKMVCIDCGAHKGAISDIFLHTSALVYAFEPNIYLHAFLKHKYQGVKDMQLYQKAVSNGNYITEFRDNDSLVSDGSTIVKDLAWGGTSGYKVEVIDLIEFIKQELLSKYERIYFLKLDVEGAEFDIMDKLLKHKLHEKIDFIACETHERGFEDGVQKMQKLKTLIAQSGAKNIALDWI
ncbi:FkbM family methyltransferase [Campylobacter sp. MIT 97-5078]|uniref:FkbM family methyltransferase n=1 Tax=Campylobacter sp. MIT 97-5078 TaxID=1548153 RepID=UPI000B109411|nr:FkbM family methyltransferase [Campylobacter sp. MIT 97-5078]TQR27914.1 FkbM family methyltransferase [Campylobacter sp. MIT 97-5078]